MRVHEQKRSNSRDEQEKKMRRDKKKSKAKQLTNLAGLQQLGELFLVHLDYSLGSTATKRNAKDEEKEEKEKKKSCGRGAKKKRFYLFSPRGEKKN